MSIVSKILKILLVVGLVAVMAYVVVAGAPKAETDDLGDEAEEFAITLSI